MTKERAGAWTRTSRVIRARPEELYAAFLDPTALVDWLPPAEMTGEIHDFDAGPRFPRQDVGQGGHGQRSGRGVGASP